MDEKFEVLLSRLSLTLRRITYKLNGHFTFFDDDDLFQEALEHLWVVFREGKLQDKTESYILQGCYFHLKNYIRKTMDKVRLASLNAIIDEGAGDLADLIIVKDTNFEETVETSFLEDSLVAKLLTERERKVVSLSLSGLTVREIGRQLDISHVMVVKIKKRIKDKCSGLRNKYSGGYQN